MEGSGVMILDVWLIGYFRTWLVWLRGRYAMAYVSKAPPHIGGRGTAASNFLVNSNVITVATN